MTSILPARRENLPFLLLFFAFFLPPSLLIKLVEILLDFFRFSFLSLFLSPLLLSSPFFASPSSWWRSCQLASLAVAWRARELEKSRITILLFFLSSSPVFFSCLPLLSSSRVLSLATQREISSLFLFLFLFLFQFLFLGPLERTQILLFLSSLLFSSLLLS